MPPKTSFGSAKKIIRYFDKFHLQSRKYISYLKWRKIYLLIQDKEHITEKGINKIIKIKSSSGYAGGTSLAVGSSRTNILTLKVFKFSDIFEKIVPLFNKYKVLGVKSEDFNSWCQAVELIKDQKHLTSKGLDEIRQIKSVMNKGRPESPE